MAGALILAAGEAKRAGGPKVTWPFDGLPSIRRVALAALAAEEVSETVAVLGGPWADQAARALDGLAVKIVYNNDYAQGQSTSLKAGLAGFDPALRTVIFLLADQPFLASQIIDGLLRFHEELSAPISAPVLNGRRLNPVVFDLGRFRSELTALKGDKGGREIIGRHQDELALWPAGDIDPKCFADFDTVEEYERLKQ